MFFGNGDEVIFANKLYAEAETGMLRSGFRSSLVEDREYKELFNIAQQRRIISSLSDTIEKSGKLICNRLEEKGCL